MEDNLSQWAHTGVFQGKFLRILPSQGGNRAKTGSVGYGSDNNVKHGEMEDSLIDFTLATAAYDAAFTKMTTANGNLSTQLRQQEDQIQALQMDIWNLKLAAVTKANKEKVNNKGRQPYAREKKHKTKWKNDPTEKKNSNKNYC